MKFGSRFLNSVVFSFGLFTVNTIFSAPVKAQVSCEAGNISQHSNGSLASCILSSNATVQVSHPRAGSFIFLCKRGNYISFDAKGQFQRCVLSAPVEIKTGNASPICPAEHRVYISIYDHGNQSVTCHK